MLYCNRVRMRSSRVLVFLSLGLAIKSILFFEKYINYRSFLVLED